GKRAAGGGGILARDRRGVTRSRARRSRLKGIPQTKTVRGSNTMPLCPRSHAPEASATRLSQSNYCRLFVGWVSEAQPTRKPGIGGSRFAYPSYKTQISSGPNDSAQAGQTSPVVS